MVRTVDSTHDSNYEGVRRSPKPVSVICDGSPYTESHQLSTSEIQRLRQNSVEAQIDFTQN